MLKIKKYIWIILLGLSISSPVQAQKKYQGEIFVSAGGGLYSLSYKIPSASVKPKLGGEFGLGYLLFFNDNWGVSAAAEFTFYNAQVSLDKFTEHYMTNDGEYDFEFRSSLSGYKEKHKTTWLAIPFKAQYQTSGKHKSYAAMGVTFAIPLTSSYQASSFSVKTSGYYEQWDALLEGPTFMGFGTFEMPETKGKLPLRLTTQLSAEIGMKWQINEKSYLYTGLCFEYGLNSMIKKTLKDPVLEYNSAEPTNFSRNNLLTSESAKRTVPLAIGIKLRMTLGSGSI